MIAFIITYLICGILGIFIGYKIGMMKIYCEPDAWGMDEGTPFGFIILMMCGWWLALIVSIITIISNKINNYFYKKINK